jgi:dipeptidyl-peptidase-4
MSLQPPWFLCRKTVPNRWLPFPDGNKVAFVRQNNLFVKDLIKNEEIQITNDGKINAIINGIPDWVYEEEFEYSRAFEWSPDSKKIAWCRFDESNVRTFAMTMFKGLRPELKDMQPTPV